jgi:hypothetical protein
MAKRCFVWICKRQQIKVRKGHARLIMVKNTAYAWRQMIFFLSLASEDERREFLAWAEDHLTKQSDQFQQRFRPAMIGLTLGLEGALIEAHAATGARRFLGWSKDPHWLLAGMGNDARRALSNRILEHLNDASTVGVQAPCNVSSTEVHS